MYQAVSLPSKYHFYMDIANYIIQWYEQTMQFVYFIIGQHSNKTHQSNLIQLLHYCRFDC